MGAFTPVTGKDADAATAPAAPDAQELPAEFADAYSDLLDDPTIQFEMAPFEPPETPGWLRWLGDFLSSDHPTLSGLIYVIAGVVALIVLFFFARWMSGREWPWRRGAREPVEAGWRPDEAPARALLSEADRLAASGLYGEAAHLLLFRSIEDIDSRRPDLVRPALTSRDIAGLADIPSRPRGAFARIAMLVERSLFARVELVEADWRDCRSAYEEFAFADGWRG